MKLPWYGNTVCQETVFNVSFAWWVIQGEWKWLFYSMEVLGKSLIIGYIFEQVGHLLKVFVTSTSVTKYRLLFLQNV